MAGIKAGQQRPSRRQLDDLLAAAGIEPRSRQEWLDRFDLLERAEAAPLVVAREVMDQPTPTFGDEQAAPRSPLARAVLLGAAAVVVLIALVVALVNGRTSVGAASPTPPSPTLTTPRTDPSRSASGTIDEPLDGVSVGVRSGVRLSGSTGAASADSLWLVDRDSDGVYTADTVVDSKGPGTWTAEDAPVGEVDDLPQQLTILLLEADDTCAAFLRRAADADDSSFDVLPAGCVLVDRVEVRVDRP